MKRGGMVREKKENKRVVSNDMFNKRRRMRIMLLSTGEQNPGIDDVEVQVDITTVPTPETIGQKARVQLGAEDIITSAVSSSSPIVSDYDKCWFQGAHPSVFP